MSKCQLSSCPNQARLPIDKPIHCGVHYKQEADQESDKKWEKNLFVKNVMFREFGDMMRSIQLEVMNLTDKKYDYEENVLKFVGNMVDTLTEEQVDYSPEYVEQLENLDSHDFGSNMYFEYLSYVFADHHDQLPDYVAKLKTVSFPWMTSMLEDLILQRLNYKCKLSSLQKHQDVDSYNSVLRAIPTRDKYVCTSRDTYVSFLSKLLDLLRERENMELNPDPTLIQEFKNIVINALQ
jgi:hypothetical protein